MIKFAICLSCLLWQTTFFHSGVFLANAGYMFFKAELLDFKLRRMHNTEFTLFGTASAFASTACCPVLEYGIVVLFAVVFTGPCTIFFFLHSC